MTGWPPLVAFRRGGYRALWRARLGGALPADFAGLRRCVAALTIAVHLATIGLARAEAVAQVPTEQKEPGRIGLNRDDARKVESKKDDDAKNDETKGDEAKSGDKDDQDAADKDKAGSDDKDKDDKAETKDKDAAEPEDEPGFKHVEVTGFQCEAISLGKSIKDLPPDSRVDEITFTEPPPITYHLPEQRRESLTECSLRASGLTVRVDKTRNVITLLPTGTASPEQPNPKVKLMLKLSEEPSKSNE